jgi:hypothetical protein
MRRPLDRVETSIDRLESAVVSKDGVGKVGCNAVRWIEKSAAESGMLSRQTEKYAPASERSLARQPPILPYRLRRKACYCPSVDSHPTSHPRPTHYGGRRSLHLSHRPTPHKSMQTLPKVQRLPDLCNGAGIEMLLYALHQIPPQGPIDLDLATSRFSQARARGSCQGTPPDPHPNVRCSVASCVSCRCSWCNHRMGSLQTDNFCECFIKHTNQWCSNFFKLIVRNGTSRTNISIDSIPTDNSCFRTCCEEVCICRLRLKHSRLPSLGTAGLDYSSPPSTNLN